MTEKFSTSEAKGRVPPVWFLQVRRRLLSQLSYPVLWNIIFRYVARKLAHGLKAVLFPQQTPHGAGREILLRDLPTLCISLTRRQDRRARVVSELNRAGLSHFGFFDAVSDENGMLGCSLSHLHVLRASDRNRAMVITEDDVQFLVNSQVIEAHVAEFLSNPALDVLCLANNSHGPIHPISSRLAIATRIRTTACYVVKPRALPALVRDFASSVRLLASGMPGYFAAADVSWEKSQLSTLIFAIPQSELANQSPSFSDIENRFVDYSEVDWT